MPNTPDTKREARTRRPLLTVAAIVGLGIAVVCVACTGRTSQEQASPLGCDESKRHYYNPGSRECVEASLKEEALVLATFRRVHALGIESRSLVTYRISFARSLGEHEFLGMIEDLGVAQVNTLQLDFADPNESLSYSLPPGTKPAEAARATLDVAVRTHEGGLPALSGAFAAGRYTVWFAEVEADASLAGPWWERHWKDVTIMQPIVSSIDKLLPVLEPYRENGWER